jgi:hypothetical protein
LSPGKSLSLVSTAIFLMKISVLNVITSITVILSLPLPVKTPKQSRSFVSGVRFPVHFFLIRE